MPVRSPRLLRTALFPAAAVALLVGLSACSSTANDSPELQISDSAILLDVRTAEEYAAGHLAGAEKLDFTGGEVAAAIPNLNPEAEYYVYCRSGNRSGQAAAMMEAAGFTDVTDLGSIDQAAASTGIEIVND